MLATKWDEPNPNYGSLITLMGSAPGTAHENPCSLFSTQEANKAAFGLANLATRSPTLLAAFCPARLRQQYIIYYIGHLCSIYPMDPLGLTTTTDIGQDWGINVVMRWEASSGFWVWIASWTKVWLGKANTSAWRFAYANWQRWC